MAMEQWQSEQHNKFGAGNLDYVDYLTFTDKLGLLTANATTPYLMAFPNMKDTGPLVADVPAGAVAGGILDFWQRPLTDCGQTGPDKGAGGKYLILGPNDPDVKPEGYFVVRTPTINVWLGMRVLDPNRDKALATMAALRIYPYSQRDNPPTTPHVQVNGRKWSGVQPRGLAYWESLSKVINEESVLERDRMILGMLQPLGSEKGKDFNPDARQKRILLDAAQAGEVMARTIGFAKRCEGVKVWPGKQWDISLFLKETSQEARHYTQFDERTSWFYEAVGVSVGMMGRTVGFGQSAPPPDEVGSVNFESQPRSSTQQSTGTEKPKNAHADTAPQRLRVGADLIIGFPSAQGWGCINLFSANADFRFDQVRRDPLQVRFDA